MRLQSVLIVWAAAASAGVACAGQDAAAGREALDAEFRGRLESLAVKCEQLELPEQARITRDWPIRRQPGRLYLALVPDGDPTAPDPQAPTIVQQWHSRLTQYRREHAQQLFELALRQLDAHQATAAYQLLHEVLREDPDHARTRHALGFRRSGSRWVSDREGLRVTAGRATHPRFAWRRNRYWRVESPHFQITTSHDRAAGVELAEKLERFQSVWRQVFFRYWSSEEALADRLAGGDAVLGAAGRHKVVLFRDRDEYLEKLAQVEPQIAVSLGYYAKAHRTSYFYAQDAAAEPTWLHETAHQLFQEAGNAVEDAGEKWNFWIIEGIAVYLESCLEHGDYVTLGGCDAERLQPARLRCLRGARPLPLSELVQLGRADLQRHPDIRQLYTDAAGLTHFLMNGADGRFREPLVAYLQAVYLGRDATGTLAALANTSYDDLERQYPEFLVVTDDDLAALNPPAHVRQLSLGITTITDRGLERLAPYEQLEWLDLAFTPITDRGLAGLAHLRRLRELSLEGTRITDASLPIVANFSQLEKLDLAQTAVSDDGLRHLAGLPELHTLYLSETAVSDAALVHLEKLSKLQYLDVEGTQVSPAGLARLKEKLPGLESDL